MTITSRNEDLWFAVTGQDVELVRDLLGKGANPNHRPGGWTVLGKALRHGQNEDCALALLEAGAHPTAHDGAGMLPMAGAIYRGWTRVVQHLLANGVEMTAENMATLCTRGWREGFEVAWPYWKNRNLPPYVEREPGRPFRRLQTFLEVWPTLDAPEELWEAMNALPVEDKAWDRLLSAAAANKQAHLLERMMAQERFSVRADRMVYHCIDQCWEEGARKIMARWPMAGDHESPSEEQTSVMGAMMWWMRDNKQSKQRFALLQELWQHGFSARHNSQTPPYTPPFPIVIAFAKTGFKSPMYTRRILMGLVQHGADIRACWPKHETFSSSFDGWNLANFLLDFGHHDSAEWVARQWPEVAWERPEHPLLFQAMRAGRPQMKKLVQAALRLGAKADKQVNGQTVLQAFLQCGYDLPDTPDILQLLLRAGACREEAKSLTETMTHAPQLQALWMKGILGVDLVTAGDGEVRRPRVRL